MNNRTKGVETAGLGRDLYEISYKMVQYRWIIAGEGSQVQKKRLQLEGYLVDGVQLVCFTVASDSNPAFGALHSRCQSATLGFWERVGDVV